MDDENLHLSSFVFNETLTKNHFSRRPNHNDRNTKHGRGGRAPTRDGKRAYDRRSGTGRGREIKKGGGGARNWGSDKQEAKRNQGKVVEGEEAPEASESQENTQPPADGEQPKEQPEEETQPEPEPEDNTMTYAEYMASKGAKKEESIREVENEFKNMKASAKVEEDFFSLGGGKKKKEKKKAQEKQTIQANFRVVRIVFVFLVFECFV